MDPLSITSGVISILGLTGRVIGGLNIIVNSTGEFKDAIEEVTALASIFLQIQEISAKQQWTGHTMTLVRPLLQSGAEVLEELNGSLTRASSVTRSGRRVIRKTQWLLERSQVRRLIGTLRELRFNLQATMSSHHLEAISDVRVILGHIQNTVETLACHQESLRELQEDIKNEQREMLQRATQCRDMMIRSLWPLIRTCRLKKLAGGQLWRCSRSLSWLPGEDGQEAMETILGMMMDDSATDQIDITEKINAETLVEDDKLAKTYSTEVNLSLRFSKKVKQFCTETCPCSCHRRREFHSPPRLSAMFGKMYLRYSRIPSSSGPCNAATCVAMPKIYARFSYTFPGWFLSRIVKVFLASSYGDISAFIKIQRIVPPHSDILRLASLDDVEGMRLLFTKRIASPRDVCATDGRTVLHTAVNNLQFGACKLLLDEGADQDCEDDNGVSAAETAWVKILSSPERSIEKEALQDLFPNSSCLEKFNFSKIHKVVLGIHGARLEDVLEGKFAPTINVRDAQGITPLSWATRRGDDEKVLLLLQRGADPNLCDINGTPPLHHAANLSSPESILALVRSGADVNKADKWERNALFYALGRRHNLAYLAPFVQAGIDLDHREYWGTSLLAKAAVDDNYLAVAWFLQKGVDVDGVDVDGDSAVFDAIHHNSHASLRLLIHSGANLHTVNRWGHTVLHMAALYGDIATMDILAGAHLHSSVTERRNGVGLTASEVFEQKIGRSQDLVDAFSNMVKSVAQSSRADSTEASSVTDEYDSAVSSMTGGSEKYFSAEENTF